MARARVGGYADPTPAVRITKRRFTMRNRDVPTVVRLLEHARYEVLPTPTIEEKVLAGVPTDVQITVTASPTKGLGQTFDLAERLAKQGYDVVPHLAARMVSGRSELEEIVARLVGFGVTTVFVPGGDADPVGDYPDSVALLHDLTELGSPFARVGITGYPESHPAIHDDVTIQAMWDKRKSATHVVSNMTFDPRAVSDWLHRMRLRGITLPLLMGLPGPVDRAKLLAMATKIGVGDSTRFLTKHKGLMARLAAPGGFTGEKFLEKCAPAFGDPEALVEGLHLYTFNQVAETEAWRRELLGRLRG
jgi:methylenetetrahydrofolate reductase (NADPH)